jgi:DNA-binding PadR family transcriptional regulator
MHPISNVEFMLLQMIAECGQASGYDIKKLVDERGYRQWANIGTTSIYVGLKKLSDKGWIVSEESTEKFGKGPSPNRFALTEAGMVKLQNEIYDSLSSTRERDNRFDLGLAAMPLIEKENAMAALRKRLVFLQEVSTKINQKYELQGGVQLPLHVRSLFLHSLKLIDSEREFVCHLLKELQEMREDGQDH